MTEPDRVAENLVLDDQIRAAESAADHLANLTKRAAELPTLKRERERRQLEERARDQLDAATVNARRALRDAGETLNDCRARFTALAADLARLAEDIKTAQGMIRGAADELGEAVRAEVGAEFYGRLNTEHPHLHDRDILMALTSRWAELWTEVGAGSWKLMAFPGADTRLQHALIDVVSNAAGTHVYHPGFPNLFSPFGVTG